MKGALEALAERWRDEAAVLRRCGHEQTAALCEAHADQLGQAWRQYRLELLSVKEASRESGYTASYLYHALADGTLPNCGKRRAPLVRRCDLPRKPRVSEHSTSQGERLALLSNLEDTLEGRM